MEQNDIITQFKDNTSLVSSIVYEVQTVQQALETAVSICKTKTILDRSISPENNLSTPQGQTDSNKTLAVHDLDSKDLGMLEELCLKNEITLLADTLRNHGNGIDVGLTFADYGIAETGTLVVSCASEEKRLATMVSDIHVAVLPVSKIRATALGMVQELEELTSKPFSYTAFITGPSRTADIERVLAIGVHGPLELHILLLDDQADDQADAQIDAQIDDQDPTQKTEAPRS